MNADRLDRQVIRLILVLVFGAFLALANTTMVGVALPRIGRDLDVGLSGLTWVSTGYVLALGLAIVLSGWAVARAGLRRTWFGALSLFVVGSALAAVAPDTGFLIAARVVQGIGGGMLEPVMLAAVALAAGPRRMGAAMGVVAGVIALGPLVGPILAGVVAEQVGWRWLFGLFVPLGVLALMLSVWLLPEQGSRPRPLDIRGLALLAVGVTGVLLGLSRGTTNVGLDAVAGVLILAGLAVLSGYLAWARRRGAAAVVDLAPIRTRGFLPAAVIMLVLGAAIYPLFFGIPQFFQGVQGRDAQASGLLLAPQGVGAGVTMMIGARLSDRLPARPIALAGASLAGLGNLAFVLLGTDAPLWAYLLALFVSGAGVGFVGGPTTATLFRVLAPTDVPAGSTILFLLNQLGGALGITVLAVLLGPSRPGAAAWTGADGTWPLLLPVIGCVLIALLVGRLPRPD